MKKYKIFLPFVAVALALVSCNSTMDDKDEIDGKYAVGTAPTVAIATANGGSSAVTVSGTVSDASKAAEVGVRIASSEDMADAAYWPASAVTAEFTAVAKKLQPLTTYYIQAYVVAKDNRMAFSDVQKVETGEPEFGKAHLAGTYSGTTIAATGEERAFSVTIEIDDEDSTKCVVNDLDPYFASYGYVASEGYNYYEGVIDWQKKTITIEGGQMVGYGSVFIIGLDDADYSVAEGYDDIYIDVLNYGETLLIKNAFGVADDEGFWEIYNGNLRLEKK